MDAIVWSGNHKTVVEGHRRISTPVGVLKVTATAKGISSILPDDDIQLTVDHQPAALDRDKISEYLKVAIKELTDYFSGNLTAFSVTLDLQGTEFQQSVWQALMQVPYGETCSYVDIARKIHRPKASRAVGAANGANPVAIMVPCHRVIGKNGTMTGYAHGLNMKRWLLMLENESVSINNLGEPIYS
ncbi:methylated-DNA--[protein]-cysteine S-methyltransferase [Endozoicomonas ascidiicola]|uniref:methylated-DNA--[protein]-cysteine S-methyltransferase n=1 Tax=Endozoicomonas ascidiicola TaxID=1698521 RepID=UPI000829E094|nr:methylated-DNA--[protein]-cysteine S-methyltransferase [Endozoicomonas ascidiicola]